MKKKLYIFIFTMIFMFLGSIAQAKDLKVVQVTDLHYQNNEYSDARLTNLVRSINKTKNVDVVLFTGDNIDSPSEVTLKKYLKAIKRLNVPYYIQIGNHDCYKAGGFDKPEYLHVLNKYTSKHLKSFNYVVKKDNVVFIFVDGQKSLMPGPNGYYKQDTLAWLDKQLKKYEKYPVVLVQHFPLLRQRDITHPSSHDLYKSNEYYNIISKYNNVLAIVSGHYHYDREEQINGVRHIISSPASGKKPCYKIIYLQEEGKNSYSIMTQIVEF